MNRKQENIAFVEVAAGNRANPMHDSATTPYCAICTGPLLLLPYFQARKPIYAAKVIPYVHPKNSFHITSNKM